MSATERTDGQIEAIETRLAHQDRAVDDLNEAVLAQWKEIDRLSRLVARLETRLAEAEERNGRVALPEPPPPHY